MKRALLLLCVALLANACAAPGPIKGRLHYGIDDAPEGQKLMWPAAPEVPRVAA